MLPLPPVTRALLFANFAAFAAQTFYGDALLVYFALWPLGMPSLPGLPGFLPWQIVTYGFLHGSLMHILFNMFAVYMFGGEVERVIGPKRYLNLYFGAVITAALTQIAVQSIAGADPLPTVGASGGVFGLLLAFGLFFPNRIILLLIPPVPLPARLLVVLYGALELFLGVTGTQQGVAHFAHLGGMLGAWLVIRQWLRRTR
ncbi:MAG: rhomboid family intramembrane serine protease [Betaproteobacteria bacterium]|nr:rhomboid family intramembrane serine protease [Betaproteobacteria bacterium]